MDGGHNPTKQETSFSRLSDRTPSISRFHQKLFNNCLDADMSQYSEHNNFEEYCSSTLVPLLALPKYNKNQITRYYSMRDAFEYSAMMSLVQELVSEGSLVGYETTILEGDSRLARLAVTSDWNGQEVGAVLGQDSDFIIFNCNYIPFSKLNMSTLQAAMICKDSFITQLRSLAVNCVTDILIEGGMLREHTVTVKNRFESICTIDRLRLLLPDLANLSGNDFYDNKDCNVDISFSNSVLAPHLLRHFENIIRRPMLPKCPPLRLYSINSKTNVKYSQFIELTAFLLLCCLSEYDKEASAGGGLDIYNPNLYLILFGKKTNKIQIISSYEEARNMYGLDNDFALNVTPIELQNSFYGDLYKRLDITRFIFLFLVFRN
jgi:hypothetical protein